MDIDADPSPTPRSSGSSTSSRPRSEGRGVILALPHSGNWDAAGVWLADWLGGPFTTVAERLKPESLYDRFVALPRVARHGGPAADRRAATAGRCCASG